MPQRQPKGALEELEARIVRAYAESWRRVLAAQKAIADDPAQFRRARRLEEVRRAIERDMARLDALTAEWLGNELSLVYAMGAGDGASELGESVNWAMIDRGALARLAEDGANDLLAATRHVNLTTKRLVRAVAGDELLAKLIEGDTAEAAGRRVRQILEQRGVSAITYADGSRHGLAEYSQMIVRTKTAKAYNAGVLGAQDSLGVKYWETFDGALCCWYGHDLGPLANGMVVSRAQAEEYPISHPNCRRAFGARTDVSTAKEAKAAGPTPTDAQRADQAQAERRRQAIQRARIARRRAARRAAS